MVKASPSAEQILDVLRDHFGRTDEELTPEQVATVTALSVDVVQQALAGLWKAHRVEGIDTAEQGYPGRITGVASPSSAA